MSVRGCKEFEPIVVPNEDIRALIQGRDVLGELAAHAFCVQEFFRPMPWILPGSDTEMDMHVK